MCAFISMLNIATPTNFSQAVLSPDWKKAMQQEYDALLANATWDLVPWPPDHNVIQTKWVYKVKQKSDGSLDRYKAHFVEKGFQQVDGVDFAET